MALVRVFLRLLTCVSLWLLLCLSGVASAAQAASLLVIVSPQNSADLLSGARNFLQSYPDHQLVLRTTDQFSELPETGRRQLVQGADAVFAGGVFGDSATLLLGYESLIDTFIAAHSDRRLVRSSRLQGQPLLAGADLDALMEDPPLVPGSDLQAWLAGQLTQHPDYRDWLLAKAFWAGRNGHNIDGLLRHLLTLTGESGLQPLTPQVPQPLRVRLDGVGLDGEWLELHEGGLAAGDWQNDDTSRWVVLLDYEHGDRPGERELAESLCQSVQAEGRRCLWVLAKWGEASVQATELLTRYRDRIGLVVSLQNFVIGAGEGRAAVNAQLAELDVPVLKAIRLTDATEPEWRLSEEGLRWDSVHYRVAMPELQGVAEPLVVAAVTPPRIDPATGLRVTLSEPVDSQVRLLRQRVARWLALQEKDNADKKLAIIYYNHPPGRHNIGADNLNVVASLFDTLHQLQAAGYDTGELPASEEALLDLLQARGVNLPEDRQALKTMAEQVQTVSADTYRGWFAELPAALQLEMVQGPLGYLHEQLPQAVALEERSLAEGLVRRVLNDLQHAVEGAGHPARERVLRLLQQLQQLYSVPATEAVDWQQARQLVDAIAASGIEGLRGWGPAPGNVMVHEGQILLPGLQFGKVFVGPQPPRGWELNEELLHANLSFPPPHQYLAFYQWLRHGFNADAVVHLGRHSTYEFLPRHRVGLSDEDYPQALLGDLPSIYPYIVDGVGEGIQAKRRGLAVIVDHLTPPLDSTELYDQLLELRHLVESYEAAPEQAGAMRQRAIEAMKAKVDELQLRDELMASMAEELRVRGITVFEQVDDELLVHEVGHYLTHLQESFMPLGLHVFGRDWSDEAMNTMLDSMAQGSEADSDWRRLLELSPAAEMDALLAALNGRYVEPGKGNDPIRTPEALPTGRNFYALDGSLLPSRLGYQVGVELAEKARQSAAGRELEADRDAEAVVLWASDVVRDEGAMIAFGLDMLGIKPVWSSRGNLRGLERLDLTTLSEAGQPRRRHDTVFTTSGLFRDLYGAHLVLLEEAVLMALDASSDLIRERYPALTRALDITLEPLVGKHNPGREPLALNGVAARWVSDARAALKQGMPPEQAGPQAAYRVFGDAPGSYGTGVNRLVERSGSWQERSQVADTYMHRMGHAYGVQAQGEPMQAVFKQRLASIQRTYLGRSSNLYGLLDNNDAFDYLGGLSLAVETQTGSAPDNFILFHPDATRLSMEPLEVALLAELRGRFLNPQWLQPLMEEGYAGARTMGSEFLEYLWGWQVTNPGIVKSWVWDEVKAVYVDDRLELGLDEFLEDGHNTNVKANMLAIMLVAAEKGFWQAEAGDLQSLAETFTRLVLEHGLPGSGHTAPGHPLYDFLEDHVSVDQYQRLQQLLADARVDKGRSQAPSVVAEVQLPAADRVPPNSDASSADTAAEEKNAEKTGSEDASQPPLSLYAWLAGILLLLALGWLRGSRAPAR